jgi:tetratricopeptide (TPR) repeat protein
MKQIRSVAIFFVFLSLSFVSMAEEPVLNMETDKPAVSSESSETADAAKETVVAPPEPATQGQMSSTDYVNRAWEASAKNDINKINEIVGKCVEVYGNEAKLGQSQLQGFPGRGQEKNYQALNDVATCLFVQAEAVMNAGKTEEAVKLFKNIIDNYKWAQSWDPRGWYWSVAEKSQASIDVLTGKAEDENQNQVQKRNRTIPNLKFPGKEKVIDYSKYGKFLNVGTDKYKYTITDVDGLSAAIGEGIYPDSAAIYKDPRYKELKDAGKLEGSHWDFVNTDNLEEAFYKWVTAPEPWGVRLFYLGTIFEKADMYYEAVKAYQALIIHFPKTVAWTYWQTPWYPAQAAVAKIRHLIRIHPELNLADMWMKVDVRNGFDNNVDNDLIVTYPGKIIKKTPIDMLKEKIPFRKTVALGKVIKTLGEGKVQLVQYENKHWQMLVNKKPYVIHGITYAPTKIGESPDKGTLANWMEQDTNKNGLPDGPYDSWVDENKNNQQDPDEKTVGDFKLMKEMGVNTLRIYNHPQIPNKELLRKMYSEYGLNVIMGHFLGKYALESGATWSEGTDYENPVHQKNLMESVKKMVMEYKDEPYIIMWLLGNENNYGVASNADKKPEAYYKFVNEVAKMIKSIDKDHPVAIGNGDALFLDIFAREAPNVDIFAGNVYRGDYGFGSFWEQVLEASNRPAFITEYGSPAYTPYMTHDESEQAQANYHKGNWLDIEDNLAGTTTGAGNALGGVIFEWMDEWWKNYEPFRHDRKSDAVGPFPGGYYFEEWFGLVGQGNGTHSPFLRQLRKSYYMYKDLWKENTLNITLNQNWHFFNK